MDAVDTVRSGHSGIVVFGGEDIVFGAKRSHQWMQWTQWMQWNSGRSMQWMQWNSGIWWWGHCLWCKKVKPVDAVDTVHSGHSNSRKCSFDTNVLSSRYLSESIKKCLTKRETNYYITLIANSHCVRTGPG